MPGLNLISRDYPFRWGHLLVALVLWVSALLFWESLVPRSSVSQGPQRRGWMCSLASLPALVSTGNPREHSPGVPSLCPRLSLRRSQAETQGEEQSGNNLKETHNTFIIHSFLHLIDVKCFPGPVPGARLYSGKRVKICPFLQILHSRRKLGKQWMACAGCPAREKQRHAKAQHTSKEQGPGVIVSEAEFWPHHSPAVWPR